MCRRSSLVLTLVAWLFATGTQWDAVQTFAWARMLATNLQTLPFSAALDRTFSPEGRCELCNAVSTAKQQREDSTPTTPGGKADGKVLMIFQPGSAVVLTAPDFAPWSRSETAFASAPRAAPPLPPPRA